MTLDIIEKIKERGYWHIVIRPIGYKKERIASLRQCKEIVQKSTVSLRGWNYPEHGEEFISNGLDYVQSIVDWRNHIEFWRMYQSGQFVNFLALWEEDWTGIESGKYLEILNTLYSLTEFYEFASRLAEKELFSDGLTIRIDLNKTMNRKLFISAWGRTLHREYICNIDVLPHKLELSQEEILGKARELALKHTLWIFERFSWSAEHLPKLLKDDQDKFLKGLV